jgi:hypothetical protein
MGINADVITVRSVRGGPVIKGPGHRIKFDVRRVWECPICRRRVRTGGHVVNLRCDCRAAREAVPAVWMKLVEESRQPAAP